MKKLLIIAGLMGLSLNASAHWYTSGVDSQSPLGTLTPVDAGTSKIYNWKQQVAAAALVAPGVLLGQVDASNDVFQAGVTVLEELTGQTYANEFEAAQALVNYANQ